jgi:Icc-related predicted phosphoesterase
VKIVAVSDVHGILPVIPAGDVLLLVGDIVPDEFSVPQVIWDAEKQIDWMFSNLKPWLEEAPVNDIVAIAGNHDWILNSESDVVAAMPWHFLDNSSVTIQDMIFHGSPWVPAFGNWAFMAPDPQLTYYWDQIPQNVEVLLTHGPPYGILDKSYYYGQPGVEDNGVSVGSGTLRQKLEYGEFPQLKLHVFGHIHGNRGVVMQKCRLYCNVSQMDDKYYPTNRPMEFEI